MALVYPGDFENEPFSPENDPDGLREQYYLLLQEMCLTFKVDLERSIGVHEENVVRLSVTIDKAGVLSIVSEIRERFTLSEILKLIDIDAIYNEKLQNVAWNELGLGSGPASTEKGLYYLVHRSLFANISLKRALIAIALLKRREDAKPWETTGEEWKDA